MIEYIMKNKKNMKRINVSEQKNTTPKMVKDKKAD